jgi:hypothetical protein
VCVSGNQLCALACRKCELVIVAGIDGVNGRRAFGIRHDLSKLLEQANEATPVFRGNSTADLRLGQRSLDLVEERSTNDELELPCEPQFDQSSRRACSRDQSRDEDVCVEDGPHALGAAAFVLRLHREAESLLLVEVRALPDAFEQIEPEIAPERFLDHVAVTAAASGRPHAHGTQNPLVERDGGSRLGHNCIIASL